MRDERLLAQRSLGVLHLVRRTIEADLRRLGKNRLVDPALFPVLASLKHKAYNVSELAGRFEVSLPSMSKTVAALVKRSWVERVCLSTDRRVVQLHLTGDGKAILGEMRD